MTSIRSILVRDAKMHDSPAIAALSGELGYETTSEDVAARLDYLLNSQDHGIFVAVQEYGEVVGWIHAYVGFRLTVENFADLGGLVVAEAFRRQGIGEKLLHAAEEWARSKGLNAIRIRSRDSRVEAHRFYQSKDYEIQKTQIVFRKNLS